MKKNTKRITVMVALALVISTLFATTAFAATSYYPGEYYLGHFTFTDANTGAMRIYNADKIVLKQL